MSKMIIKRSMLKQRYGSIINIASVVGTRIGNPGQSVYAASKAGLVGFTASLAKEVGAQGIRVNAVAPGFINTDMTKNLDESLIRNYKNQIPLGTFGDAMDVAKTVYFLHETSYITGTCITIDGGLTC